MEIRAQKYVARLLVVTLAAMTTLTLFEAPARATDAPSELPPNPYLAAHSSNVEFRAVAEYNGRDAMHADIDIDVSLPGGCPEGYACEVNIMLQCLYPTGYIEWSNYNHRTWEFTESAIHVRHSPTLYWFTGCRPNAVAHGYYVGVIERTTTSLRVLAQ